MKEKQQKLKDSNSSEIDSTYLLFKFLTFVRTLIEPSDCG
jgi:hypothetical protein